jgi:membrane fusion protein (multidrug efflux system)
MTHAMGMDRMMSSLGQNSTKSAEAGSALKDPTVEKAHSDKKPKVTNNTKRKLFLSTLFLVMIGAIWISLWFFYFQYYESTDDAYANGNMLSINSAISGSVTAFYADNTDLVEEGQILVMLDPTNYQIAYEKALASLGSTVLQVRQLHDQVLIAKAAVENKRVAMSRAEYDYNNRSQLVDSLAISKEDFIHSQDSLNIAKFEFEQAEAQLKVAVAAAGNTSIESHPLIEQQKANVREAYYQLKHCAIFAPMTGYIAQRKVEVGQWVTPTTAMMAIIPTDYVWVDANFKETQLTYMRVGQPAKVWLDIYGSSVIYEGKVLGIASGTGSVFSLIPPQNATGNWIKIVQRLPVRISLDPQIVKRFPIRLGLSAEVKVDLANQDLPMLTEIPVPPAQPIADTRVFDIDLEKVNQTIDQVVQANRPLA